MVSTYYLYTVFTLCLHYVYIYIFAVTFRIGHSTSLCAAIADLAASLGGHSKGQSKTVNSPSGNGRGRAKGLRLSENHKTAYKENGEKNKLWLQNLEKFSFD